MAVDGNHVKLLTYIIFLGREVTIFDTRNAESMKHMKTGWNVASLISPVYSITETGCLTVLLKFQLLSQMYSRACVQIIRVGIITIYILGPIYKSVQNYLAHTSCSLLGPIYKSAQNYLAHTSCSILGPIYKSVQNYLAHTSCSLFLQL